MNVLLVEDTEEHAYLMMRALEKSVKRPQVFWVKDGREALDFLYHQGVYGDSAANPCPDVILLDLKLPKFSGLEVLKRVKQDQGLKDIPVVMLTASDEGSDIIKCYESGADSYFTKAALFLNNGENPTTILDTVMVMAGV